MILELTNEMAEHARFVDAGHENLFINLLARKEARMAGRVLVGSYERKKA